MRYRNIVEGIFLNRRNRFIAEVKIEGKKEIVHVKNTGRCEEIFKEGVKIFLEKSNNPNRKTGYSLVSAVKNGKIINVDSQAPNKVIYEALKKKELKPFKDIKVLKKEKTFQKSRFDIYYERKNGVKGFIEIKGVTLEQDGLTKFPDAPTERGKKHVLEMVDAVRVGYEGNILFLIQMDKFLEFTPNRDMDGEFSNALDYAKNKGVSIHIYNSIVKEDSITLKERGILI